MSKVWGSGVRSVKDVVTKKEVPYMINSEQNEQVEIETSLVLERCIIRELSKTSVLLIYVQI